MRVQQEGETVDAHVTALKTLAETCNFGQLQDDLLRDKIVIGIKEKGYKEKAHTKAGSALICAAPMSLHPNRSKQ